MRCNILLFLTLSIKVTCNCNRPCDLFLAVDTAVGEQLKKTLLGGETKELVDPYLLFSFAGKEVSFYMKHNFTFLLSCGALQCL